MIRTHHLTKPRKENRMHATPYLSPETSIPPNRRLLVGEDNSALREFLAAVFLAEGYQVVTAANQEDLFDTLAVSLHPEIGSGRFDLIIAEVHMLGRLGLATLDKFEELAEAPPLVLIADVIDKKLNVDAKRSRALATLENPFDMDELRQLVRRLLNLEETRLHPISMNLSTGAG